MDKFLQKHNLAKLNQEESDTLNKAITADEIETVMKKLLTHKNSETDGFTGEFYKHLRES